MNSFNPAEENIDFEDLIARFEKNNAGSLRGASAAAPLSVAANKENISFSTVDIEPELRTLREELLDHIYHTGMKDKGFSPIATNAGGEKIHTEVSGHSGISIEVFKAEVRTALEQVRRLQTTPLDDMEIFSSMQQATFRSMKRRLAEKSEELEILQKQYKLVDSKNHRLEDELRTLASTAVAEKPDVDVDNEELARLREMNELLTKRCLDFEKKEGRHAAERDRLLQTIARLREEMQIASHHTANALVDAANAKSRCAEYEKRLAESRSSSSAISVRVKELQEVQNAMIQLVGNARNQRDESAFRRNMAALGDRRSRLVGRIAKILTRNRSSENESNRDVPVTSAAASSPIKVASENTKQIRSCEIDRNGIPDSIEDAERNEILGQRKPILNGLRKFGSDLARIGTQRQSLRPFPQRNLMADVERSRVAMENDCALREVIEMKELEIGRIEKYLFAAQEKASILQMSLQKERQRRRLHSRTTDTINEDRDSEPGSSESIPRGSTAFDWHDDEITPVRVKKKTSTVTFRSTDDIHYI